MESGWNAGFQTWKKTFWLQEGTCCLDWRQQESEKQIPLNLKSILVKYVSLNSRIENKGGREAIEGNDELEKIYEEVFHLENYILTNLHLPLLIEFRLILIDFVDIKQTEGILKTLTITASAFLNWPLLLRSNSFALKLCKFIHWPSGHFSGERKTEAI